MMNYSKEEVVIVPVVGMGCTMPSGSDSYPGTIQHVYPSGRKIVVTGDKYTRTDKNGYGGEQEYEYTGNPDGNRRTYTLRKNGKWVEEGGSLHGGSRVYIGHRRAYQDPSF